MLGLAPTVTLIVRAGAATTWPGSEYLAWTSHVPWPRLGRTTAKLASLAASLWVATFLKPFLDPTCVAKSVTVALTWPVPGDTCPRINAWPP